MIVLHNKNCVVVGNEALMFTNLVSLLNPLPIIMDTMLMCLLAIPIIIALIMSLGVFMRTIS